MRNATLVLFSFPTLLIGQEYSASLSVTTTDPSGAVVPGTHVVLVDTRWGTVHQADTNGAGMATFDALRPSDYSLEAVKPKFEKLRLAPITLAVRDRQSLHLELKVAAAETSITVTASVQGVATDASQGISVEQDYFQNLTVNGRSTEAL
ncbi:MAG: carboxypeptidase-like regulatory domain-containing protein, partial [Acidobacteria bacterium]|nr:carboxypeptidase-like regulatory domain-containing protein [Acidobacteriota bacterium]